MRRTKTAVIAVCLAVALGIAFVRHAFHSKMESPYRRGDLATLERMAAGSVSHELRWGRIFVTTVDRFGDAHFHLLHHSGVSQRRALQIVEEKETELRRKATKPRARADGEGAAAQP